MTSLAATTFFSWVAHWCDTDGLGPCNRRVSACQNTEATEGRLRQTRLARAAVAAQAQISEGSTAVEIVMG